MSFYIKVLLVVNFICLLGYSVSAESITNYENYHEAVCNIDAMIGGELVTPQTVIDMMETDTFKVLIDIALREDWSYEVYVDRGVMIPLEECVALQIILGDYKWGQFVTHTNGLLE